jgi:hypothetical protein
VDGKKLQPFTWLIRTEELVPGLEQRNLNEICGLMVVVTDVYDGDKVVAIILPSDPDNVNIHCKKPMEIQMDILLNDRLFKPHAIPKSTEAA